MTSSREAPPYSRVSRHFRVQPSHTNPHSFRTVYSEPTPTPRRITEHKEHGLYSCNCQSCVLGLPPKSSLHPTKRRKTTPRRSRKRTDKTRIMLTSCTWCSAPQRLSRLTCGQCGRRKNAPSMSQLITNRRPSQPIRLETSIVYPPHSYTSSVPSRQNHAYGSHASPSFTPHKTQSVSKLSNSSYISSLHTRFHRFDSQEIQPYVESKPPLSHLSSISNLSHQQYSYASPHTPRTPFSTHNLPTPTSPHRMESSPESTVPDPTELAEMDLRAIPTSPIPNEYCTPKDSRADVFQMNRFGYAAQRRQDNSSQYYTPTPVMHPHHRTFQPTAAPYHSQSSPIHAPYLSSLNKRYEAPLLASSPPTIKDASLFGNQHEYSIFSNYPTYPAMQNSLSHPTIHTESAVARSIEVNSGEVDVDLLLSDSILAEEKQADAVPAMSMMTGVSVFSPMGGIPNMGNGSDLPLGFLDSVLPAM